MRRPDFEIITEHRDLPGSPAEQCELVLFGSVYQRLYDHFGASSPLLRADYSRFFSVTYQDLVRYAEAHQGEVERIMGGSSGPEGVTITRQPDGTYLHREYERGTLLYSAPVQDWPAALAQWLRWLLANQGLQRLLPPH